MRVQTVRMPADYMPAKKRKELNGVAVTYSMDKPHTYYELLAFPKDIRKEYIEGLMHKYHPSIADMKRMLRITTDTFHNLLDSLDIKWEKRYRKVSEQLDWDAFIGVAPEVKQEKKPEPPKEMLTPLNYAYLPQLDHVSLRVAGKPNIIAQCLAQMLDPKKEYYYQINITEKEIVADESCSCGTGEACCIEGTA